MATAKKQTTDRRVARTRDALREALIGLILERGWDEIGVQDICGRANVGRSTFYMHFSCKDQLLNSAFDDLRKELRAKEKTPGGPHTPAFGIVRNLIAHVFENQRLFRAVIGKRSSVVVQRRFRQLVIELVEEDIAASDIPAAWRTPAAHYIAGALFELLTWWVDSRSQLSPHELENFFRELTMPVFDVLRNNSPPITQPATGSPKG